MAQFTVIFSLEAADLDAATAAVSEWVVTPGTTLHSISGSVQATGLPVTVTEGGAIGQIVADSEAGL